MGARKNNPFQKLKKEIKSAILKDYPTIENFCFIHDLPKATIFRFLSEDDCNFTANTLLKVAKALEKSLDIKLK